MCVVFSVRRVSFKFVWACVGMGDIVGGMYIVVCVLSIVFIAVISCGIRHLIPLYVQKLYVHTIYTYLVFNSVLGSF